MTREHLYLHDTDLLQAWVKERFDIDLPYSCAVEILERFLITYPSRYGCLNAAHACSAGPIIFLINRLEEYNLLRAHGKDEPLPIIIDPHGGIRVVNVARSKIFKTTLPITPIDLRAWIVAGNRNRQ